MNDHELLSSVPVVAGLAMYLRYNLQTRYFFIYNNLSYATYLQDN